MRAASVFAVFFVIAPVAVHATAAQTPGAKAALAVTDGYVVPHYRALAEAADTNVRAWDVFCNGRARGREVTLRAAYNALADRWAEIEFLKAGPMSLFLRAERFNYWPELHNATTKGLTALLAANDAAAFTPSRLVYDNIPAQGLPALERLLYERVFWPRSRTTSWRRGLGREAYAPRLPPIRAGTTMYSRAPTKRQGCWQPTWSARLRR
jgi:predicted lipoprotein